LTSPELQDYLKKNGHDLAEWPPKVWDFETLNWVAFYYNPSLELARQQWAGAQGSIVTGAERPNPSIALTPGYAFNLQGEKTPWFPGVSVDIPVETAGKRGKRIAQAQWLAEAARQNIFAAAWQVRADLRQALIEGDAAEKRVVAAQRQVEAQQRVVDLLEQRRSAGAIAADAVSSARLSLVKAQVDAANGERAQLVARSKLAEILGVPLAALAGQMLSADQFDAGRGLTPEQLVAARMVALETRADIQSALANYQASQSALQLEIAKQYPDVHLGSGYVYDLGENKFDLSVGMDLPAFNHNEGPIAEAEAGREQAAAQLLAVQARVIAQIDSAAAVSAAATGQVDGMRKVDAELHKHLDLVHAQVAAGAADSLDYQTALLDVSASELALIDAQSQAAAAAGQLEDALQVPFTNLPALSQDVRVPTLATKP
jgi:outer membrane protein TolC